MAEIPRMTALGGPALPPPPRPRSRLVDLTLTLSHGMPVAAGYPTPVVLPYPVVGEERTATYLATAEHVATHVDAPLRFGGRRASIEAMPLDWFSGPAVCLDLRHIPDLAEIDVPWLERAEEEAGLRINGHIVLLCTGFHARHWPRAEVLTRNPGLTAEATRWLADRRSKAHGVEGPSTDVAGSVERPSHRVCGARSLVHYEWLVNLEQLVGAGELVFHGFPLRLEGGTGSPVRAVAEIPL